MIKYCLPVVKEIKKEVLKTIQENPEYDFYEIWLSYIKDLNIDFVWKISDQFNGKLVFLFRKQNLEKSELKKEFKEKVIKLLENSDNSLDLDINDQKKELEFIKKENLKNKLIVSYHNYGETPKLENIVQDIEKYKPEIIKVSALCKTEEDSLKLLALLLKLKNKKKKYIVSGMGERGIIVRIFGALWGNEFNFAPVDENEKSADGQLTRERLEKILGEINGR